MQLPPRLAEIDEPITLDDFPDDDDYCHACHGASDGCVACQIMTRHRHNYYRELRAERMANEL